MGMQAMVVQLDDERDWSMPPTAHSIRRLETLDDGGVDSQPLARFASVLRRIEQTDPSHPVPVANLPMLLAALIWWGRRSSPLRLLAERLERAIREGRVLALDLLLQLTRDARQSTFGPRDDGMWGASTAETLAMLALRWAELNTWFTRLSSTAAADPLQPALAHRWGVVTTTLAVTTGWLVTWQGVRIDTERLHEGLAALKEASDDLDKALQRNFVDVNLALRPDQRVHPWYVLQAGQRLGAHGPAIQSFTHKGGPWASRSLVVPEPGEVLLELDVRQAEMVTLGLTWLLRFGHEGYLLDVLSADCDIHQRVGMLAFENRVEPADARRAGKLINNALANGGSDEAIRRVVGETLCDAGWVVLESMVAERAQEALTNLADAYPLREWRKLLEAVEPRGAWAALPHGRCQWASQGRQFASRMVQTWFADAFAHGAFRLVRAGYQVQVLEHDGVILSTPLDHAAAASNIFQEGLMEILGPAIGDRPGALRMTQWVYPERWREDEGIPLDSAQ